MKYGIEIWSEDGNRLISKKSAKDPDHARSVLKRQLLIALKEQPQLKVVGLLIHCDDPIDSFDNDAILEAAC